MCVCVCGGDETVSEGCTWGQYRTNDEVGKPGSGVSTIARTALGTPQALKHRERQRSASNHASHAELTVPPRETDSNT